MTKLPIPPSLWQRILDFMLAGRTGRIEIDVKEGRVQRVTIAESWRAGASAIVQDGPVDS